MGTCGGGVGSLGRFGVLVAEGGVWDRSISIASPVCQSTDTASAYQSDVGHFSVCQVSGAQQRLRLVCCSS